MYACFHNDMRLRYTFFHKAQIYLVRFLSLWPSPLPIFSALRSLFLFTLCNVSLSLHENKSESGASLRRNESGASGASASSWLVVGSLHRRNNSGLMTGLWNELKSFRSEIELLRLFFFHDWLSMLEEHMCKLVWGKFAHAHAHTSAQIRIQIAYTLLHTGGTKIPAFHHDTVFSPAKRLKKNPGFQNFAVTIWFASAIIWPHVRMRAAQRAFVSKEWSSWSLEALCVAVLLTCKSPREFCHQATIVRKVFQSLPTLTRIGRHQHLQDAVFSYRPQIHPARRLHKTQHGFPEILWWQSGS